MVLVSHTRKFIFLKTFKTASTSTEGYFERYCLPPDIAETRMARPESVTEYGIVGARGKGGRSDDSVWVGHLPAARVRELLSPEVWNSYFKFCTIRNPYERLVSHFAMKNEDFVRSEPDLARRRAAYRAWLLTSADADLDLHRYMIDGKVVVDGFIRFESYGPSVAAICDRLGIPFEPERLVHWRSKPERKDATGDWREYYEGDVEGILRDKYGWEIETFGYGLA